jgi:hypothetical protein
MKYILLFLILLASSLLIAEENPLAPEVELFVSQINMGSTSLTWTLEAQSTIWDVDSKNITTDYQSSSITITGNSERNWGWSFGVATQGIPLFAYSLYKLGFDSNYYIYLDYRDSNFDDPNYGYSQDVVIRYNNSTQSFNWQDDDDSSNTWHNVSIGNTLTIWEMKSQSSHTTAGFQPTSPTNLTVTNENGHPRLN